MNDQLRITLGSPLTLLNAFRFPLQSRASRHDLLIGGLVLFIPFVGWILNMGHRIVVTHKMLHADDNPWPAWGNLLDLLKHGLITFAGMVLYHIPAALTAVLAQQLNSVMLYILAAILWVLGTCVVPGYMTAYCVSYDPREVFNITRSIKRVLNARSTYWKAWLITICAMLTSFAGLLGLGLLFFWTSVWFWQAAAFCFANTMTRTSIDLPSTQ